jgi:hypothetical protein
MVRRLASSKRMVCAPALLRRERRWVRRSLSGDPSSHLLKLVFLFLEQHVERGHRTVAARDVLLKLWLKSSSVPEVDSYDAKRYSPS